MARTALCLRGLTHTTRCASRARRSISWASSAVSPLSQPSDTITTTAPRPTPRRTQPSLNCLSAGAEARSAGPVRRRGHRRPQGDRRLRRGELARQPVQRRGEHERLGPQCPYCAVQQVQVGAAVRLHRSRHVGEETNLAGSHPAPAARVRTGSPPVRRAARSVARRSIVDPDEERRLRRLRRLGGVTISASMRRRSLSSSSSLHCSNGLARSRSSALAAAMTCGRSSTVVRTGFRIVGQPGRGAAVGAERRGSARRPRRRAAAPNTSSNTRLNMARSLRSTTRVARASQKSSSTRWGAAAANAAAKRRSSPGSPRLLRRVGVRRTAPRSRRDRRSLRPHAGPCLPSPGARSLAHDGTHASPTTQESPAGQPAPGPRGT